MVIMWFSGLRCLFAHIETKTILQFFSRGAIAYALSLHLEFDEEVSIVSKASSSINVKVRKVLVTTTLIVVLFTTIVLGGGTLPLVKYLVS